MQKNGKSAWVVRPIPPGQLSFSTSEPIHRSLRVVLHFLVGRRAVQPNLRRKPDAPALAALNLCAHAHTQAARLLAPSLLRLRLSAQYTASSWPLYTHTGPCAGRFWLVGAGLSIIDKPLSATSQHVDKPARSTGGRNGIRSTQCTLNPKNPFELIYSLN